MWFRSASRIHTAFCIAAPAALFGVGVYLTHSRGAVVAIALLLVIVLRKRVGTIPAGIVSGICVAALIGFGITGGRPLSAESGADRLELWRVGIDILKARPFFGVGLGNFPEYSPTHHTAHNSFVLCFSELGLIGFSFWVCMIVASLATLRKLRQHGLSTRQQMLASAAAASQISTASAGAQVQTVPSAADVIEEDATSTGIVRTADVLWYALIVFLAAGWFLSRAFTMTLFIVLGLASALQVVARNHSVRAWAPAPVNLISLRTLFKYTVLLEIISLIAIYLMVRIGGA
jgi:O-antigen ligase